jgi:hypothetical protein
MKHGPIALLDERTPVVCVATDSPVLDKEEGRRQGCTQFHLDSGVGPEREDAHRLYFNTGLRITSYHFAAPLE